MSRVNRLKRGYICSTFLGYDSHNEFTLYFGVLYDKSVHNSYGGYYLLHPNFPNGNALEIIPMILDIFEVTSFESLEGSEVIVELDNYDQVLSIGKMDEDNHIDWVDLKLLLDSIMERQSNKNGE